MPLVNVYAAHDVEEKLTSIMAELKQFIADQLASKEITLTPAEISVRLVGVKGGGMIANVELEITAAAFPERVEKQDQICLKVMEFFKEKTGFENRVWLILSELGHSWV